MRAARFGSVLASGGVPHNLSLTPPNSMVCLAHWRIVLSLLASVSNKVLIDVFNTLFAEKAPTNHFLCPLVTSPKREETMHTTLCPMLHQRLISPGQSPVPPGLGYLASSPQASWDPGELDMPDLATAGWAHGRDHKWHRVPNRKLAELCPLDLPVLFEALEASRQDEQRAKRDWTLVRLIDAHFHLDQYMADLDCLPHPEDLNLFASPFQFQALISSFAFPERWHWIEELQSAPSYLWSFCIGWHPKSVAEFPAFRTPHMP